MRESGLQLLTTRLEECELMSRERIEVVAVGPHEMAEYRARYDGCLMLQPVDQLEHIMLRIKA